MSDKPAATHSSAPRPEFDADDLMKSLRQWERHSSHPDSAMCCVLKESQASALHWIVEQFARSESGATDFSTHKFHGKVEAGDTQAGPSCRTASAEREKAERARARLDLEPDGPQPSDPEAAALWWMDRFIDMKALAVQLTEESLDRKSVV